MSNLFFLSLLFEKDLEEEGTWGTIMWKDLETSELDLNQKEETHLFTTYSRQPFITGKFNMKIKQD